MDQWCIGRFVYEAVMSAVSPKKAKQLKITSTYFTRFSKLQELSCLSVVLSCSCLKKEEKRLCLILPSAVAMPPSPSFLGTRRQTVRVPATTAVTPKLWEPSWRERPHSAPGPKQLRKKPKGHSGSCRTFTKEERRVTDLKGRTTVVKLSEMLMWRVQLGSNISAEWIESNIKQWRPCWLTRMSQHAGMMTGSQAVEKMRTQRERKTFLTSSRSRWTCGRWIIITITQTFNRYL